MPRRSISKRDPGKIAQGHGIVAPVIERAMQEEDFMRQIVEYAQWNGYLTYHTYDSRRSPPGFPDIVIARPGDALILAELKTERGRMSPDQQLWYDVLRQTTGVENYAWRPADWSFIQERLARRW